MLVLSKDVEMVAKWRTALAHEEPRIRLVSEGDVSCRTIAALVDEAPRGRLDGLPSLQVVFSATTAVDHLLDDPTLPRLPLVRLVTPATVALMREYVCYHVARRHRRFDLMEDDQRHRRWRYRAPESSPLTCRVSVLGLGRLGLPCALALRDLGYRVTGWSRTHKTIPGIRTCCGTSGLRSTLAETDILVLLLPLTSQTNDLLDAGMLERLPRGAAIINAGRAGSVVLEDLLVAVDRGWISHATLDVFESEPLQSDSPLWAHPRVTITPHVAADLPPGSLTARLARDLRLMIGGATLSDVVDRTTGY